MTPVEERILALAVATADDASNWPVLEDAILEAGGDFTVLAEFIFADWWCPGLPGIAAEWFPYASRWRAFRTATLDDIRVVVQSTVVPPPNVRQNVVVMSDVATDGIRISVRRQRLGDTVDQQYWCDHIISGMALAQCADARILVSDACHSLRWNLREYEKGRIGESGSRR